MQPVRKPTPIFRVILLWVAMLAVIVGVAGFFVWRNQGRTPEVDNEIGSSAFHSVFMFIIGVFGLVVGTAAYMLTIFTSCFTFNFQKPVWQDLRGKIFLANIFVPLIPAIGLGCIVAGLLTPVIRARGLSGGIGDFIPYIAPIVLLQIAQLWVMIWAPLERRVIFNRLGALGITPEQIQSAFLVGLSDPTAGTLKRMGTIETDMGALWVGPEQLIFWGDAEQFALNRAQVLLIEQKMDARSNTALGGVAHVILHVQMPTGVQRQIRLHTEGLWTMGQKRRVMDELGQRLATWHSTAAVPPPVPT